MEIKNNLMMSQHPVRMRSIMGAGLLGLLTAAPLPAQTRADSLNTVRVAIERVGLRGTTDLDDYSMLRMDIRDSAQFGVNTSRASTILYCQSDKSGFGYGFNRGGELQRMVIFREPRGDWYGPLIFTVHRGMSTLSAIVSQPGANQFTGDVLEVTPHTRGAIRVEKEGVGESFGVVGTQAYEEATRSAGACLAKVVSGLAQKY